MKIKSVQLYGSLSKTDWHQHHRAGPNIRELSSKARYICSSSNLLVSCISLQWQMPFLPVADRITCASILSNWKCTNLWRFEEHIWVQRHNTGLDAINPISRRDKRLSCKTHYSDSTASVSALAHILHIHTYTSNFIELRSFAKEIGIAYMHTAVEVS